MRLAGTLTVVEQARRFGAYLETQGIANRVDGAGENWEIWIRNDDQLARATEELQSFLAEPQAARYQVAVPKKAAAPVVARRAREYHYSGSTPLPYRQPIVTVIVIAVCVFVMAAMPFEPSTPRQQEILAARRNLLLYQPVDFADQVRELEMLQDGDQELFQEKRRKLENLETDEEPFSKIREGQVWRLFTPCLMHSGIMHLLMNMMVLYSFGSLIELRRGPWFMAFLILFIGIVSNTAQYSLGLFLGKGMHAAEFLGFSGVDFGMFGYAWVRSRYARLDPLWMFVVPDRTALYFLAWGVLCLTGLMGPIANTAHFTGLFVGAAIAGCGIIYRDRRSTP